MDETQPTPRIKARWLAGELPLGILIAFLSVFTAFLSYQGSLASSREGDFNNEGQTFLARSNTEFLRANQEILQDYNYFDGWYINAGRDDEIATYYLAHFSEELRDSLTRESGPWDDAYYAAKFADATASYQRALAAFGVALAASDRADGFQLALLFTAIGLSFAAWASLVNPLSRLRYTFGLFSVGALLGSFAIYLMTLLK